MRLCVMTAVGVLCRICISQPRACLMSHETLRLDPSQYPQQIELEIPAEIHERLEQLSRQMGRSVRDIAEELIHLSVAQHPPGSRLSLSLPVGPT